MVIPPEIVDRILEHIPVPLGLEGQKTLMACALVATWWTGPSQRRLFSSAFIEVENHQRWMDGVVHTKSRAHLLGYIRSLWYCFGMCWMRDLQQNHGEYFSALRNLRSLTLFNVGIERNHQEGFCTCFSPFRGTLTYLSLEHSPTSFSGFVTLIDYFPNIIHLQLRSPTLEPEARPVPTLSRPLRGTVEFHGSNRCLDFLDRFVSLDLEYDEVVIDSPYRFMEGEYMERTFQLSATTTKILRLAAEFLRE